MVDQTELDLAIRNALEGRSAELGAGSVSDNGRGAYCLRRPLSSLCLLGVLRTNEIEWWMESPEWETGYIGSDVIQEWLGEPIRAFQFNKSSFVEVVQEVSNLGKRAVLKYEADVVSALDGLTAADARNVDRSRLTRLRSEAKNAWERGDYWSVKNILSQMPRELSPVEVKRLQISRRKLGNAN